ncbi:polysaccharide pyruvyl transferase family protein [Rhodobacter sp. NSM]|uniref:polysaccharide pyruvyl transferase family protein n=1 Tax=Rhodobacter sp. NSM TaxID=3457501 RepID=UPI003FD3F054
MNGPRGSGRWEAGVTDGSDQALLVAGDAEFRGSPLLRDRPPHVRKAAHSARGRPIHVWGTGCMKPIKTDFLSNVRLHAVRGPLTAGLLNLPASHQGDSALLVGEMLLRPARMDHVGLVPHHSTWADPARIALFLQQAEALGARVIDVRSHDSLAVCSAISQCRYVFSESLHGTIVADAMGVANAIVLPDSVHDHAFLKCTTTAVPWAVPGASLFCRTRSPGRRGTSATMPGIGYAETLLEAQESIRSAFPAELVA